MTVYSKKLRKVKLKLNSGHETPIIDYFNRKNDYVVNFESSKYIYSNNKLFQDNKLLRNIDNFLRIFIEHPNLIHTTSEKGNITNNITEFSTGSVFRFVENTFQDKYTYFICDDMGREWADHIGISNDMISFYHSKSKSSTFSASDFQDIIGQAQKNFGNLAPSANQFSKKCTLWTQNYTRTQINRLRKGSSINDAITQWKDALGNSNPKRQVHIVIDFISKSDLRTNLEKLKKEERFREMNETIQILWFISSFISSSIELGIDTYIHCKP